jgi:hypothetical protein
MLPWLGGIFILWFLVRVAYVGAAEETGRPFTWATLKYLGVILGVFVGPVLLGPILAVLDWYDLVAEHPIITFAVPATFVAVPCAWYFAAKNTGRPFTWITLKYIGLSLGVISGISVMEWLQ